MGCLKNIIKIIIIIFAIIGFKAVGGIGIFQGKFNFNFFEKPSQEKMQEKASKIADLSKINDEYEIEKTANVIGFKAVMSEHKASKQKLIIIDTGKKDILTKEDFKTKEVDQKLKDLADKIKYQFIRVEDLKITERGNIQTMGQTVPFVKFTAGTVNLPTPEIKGIIGAAVGKDGKNKLILSVTDGEKYSQIITQQFFKDVK